MWRCENTIARILLNRLNAFKGRFWRDRWFWSRIEPLQNYDMFKWCLFGDSIHDSSLLFRIGTLHHLFEVYCLCLLLWHDYLGAVCTWNWRMHSKIPLVIIVDFKQIQFILIILTEHETFVKLLLVDCLPRLLLLVRVAFLFQVFPFLSECCLPTKYRPRVLFAYIGYMSDYLKWQITCSFHYELVTSCITFCVQ